MLLALRHLTEGFAIASLALAVVRVWFWALQPDWVRDCPVKLALWRWLADRRHPDAEGTVCRDNPPRTFSGPSIGRIPHDRHA